MCVRSYAPARHRLQVIDLQLHRSDFRSPRHCGVRCDRRRSVRQRRQNPPVHDAMKLLMVCTYIQLKNGPPLLDLFHVEAKMHNRLAFFHPLAHQFRCPPFFRRLLGFDFHSFPIGGSFGAPSSVSRKKKEERIVENESVDILLRLKNSTMSSNQLASSSQFLFLLKTDN